MTEQTPKAADDMTAEELRAELERVSREAYDLQHRLNGQLMNQASAERQAAATVRRMEWAQVDLHGNRIARHRAAEILQPIEGVLYRIEQLGPNGGRKQIADLKDATQNARHILGNLTTVRDAPDFDTPARQEANRVRGYVMAQGRKLHTQFGGNVSGPCGCPGCDLIRGMDVDAPSVVDAVNEARSA